MYPSEPRITAYSEFVFSNLPQAVFSGGGLYNYHELAQLVGLKPTGNFRKRVKQLVAKGKLDAVAVFTARGGIETRFQLPERPLQNGEFPF
jgi:hypothetical protein